MSASRALPEGFDANDMWAVAAPVELRMPRAQIGVARRALATDDAGGYRVACRALVEHESPVLAQSGLEEPRNRKPAGSRVAASLALLVAVSSLSGAAIAGSAALPITPTATARLAPAACSMGGWIANWATFFAVVTFTDPAAVGYGACLLYTSPSPRD